MAVLSSETVHATCVAIDGQAVLLMGVSGSGKSDLALRLIDRGATLVSDDYTLVVREGRRLIARAPERIAGQMEVRHVGIIALPFVDNMPVALAIKLDGTPERLPAPVSGIRIAGVEIPYTALEAMEASAPIKAELILQLVAMEARPE